MTTKNPSPVHYQMVQWHVIRTAPPRPLPNPATPAQILGRIIWLRLFMSIAVRQYLLQIHYYNQQQKKGTHTQ